MQCERLHAACEPCKQASASRRRGYADRHQARAANTKLAMHMRPACACDRSADRNVNRRKTARDCGARQGRVGIAALAFVAAVRVVGSVAMCAAAAGTVHLVLDVDESDVDDIDDMLVVQRIEHILPSRRLLTRPSLFKRRSWWETADFVISTSAAMSLTQSSPPAMVHKIFIRVSSPTTRKKFGGLTDEFFGNVRHSSPSLLA